LALDTPKKMRGSNVMKYRRRDAPESLPLPARFFALIRLCGWLRGDLSLQAKPLMLLGSIPAPKTKPQQSLEIAGVFHHLGCGDRI
jgi:hypothetical protein